MRLAVRKEEGRIPGGGFHYLLHPLEVAPGQEEKIYASIGYNIVDVPDATGARLLSEACAALRHQMEVAHLIDGPEPRTVDPFAVPPTLRLEPPPGGS